MKKIADKKNRDDLGDDKSLEWLHQAIAGDAGVAAGEGRRFWWW